jgi:LacI family transcriptional regulator
MEATDLIEISLQSGLTIIQQLRNQITWLIVTGKISPGELLPSLRLLSDKLGININTVRNAYELLELDGLVSTRHGTGTLVLPLDASRITRIATRNRTNTIGVILPAITDPFYHEFLRGIETVIDSSQTMMLVCDAHEDPLNAFHYYTKLIAKQVDGIICASLPLSSLVFHNGQRTEQLPFVSVDWPADKTNAIHIDLENAGYVAVKHLLDHGHVRIGIITLLEDRANTTPLLQGYQRAFNESNRVPDSDLIIKVPGFSMQDGQMGAQKLLSLSPRPTAVLAISDTIAMGVYLASKKERLKIPKDIAVIGVDNIFISELVEPPLTTVSLPAFELGAEAAKMLQGKIDGTQNTVDPLVLPTRLIRRASCGCHGI